MSDDRQITISARLPTDMGGVAAPNQDAANAPLLGDVAVAPLFVVRLFGGFQVVAPDGLNATPTGRKARALLAHLLLVGGEGVPRERLATLLWGRSGEDQARASLRQTLYEMRALAAGSSPLLIFDRTHARIAPERVRSDLDGLRAFVRGNDAAALAEQIGDPPRDLLADLESIDEGFDDWLARERIRRADERRAMLLTFGEAALADGDASGAQALAAVLLAIDPADERSARLAMAASAKRGDRDRVRQIYVRLEQSLRADVQGTPTQETVALQQSLLSESRAEAPAARTAPSAVATTTVSSQSSDADLPAPRSAPVTQTAQTAAAPERAGDQRVAIRARIVGVALLTLLATVAVVGVLFWRGSPERTRQRVLKVRPLEVAAGDGLSQALTHGLSVQLARMIVGNDTRLSVVDQEAAPGTGRSDPPVDYVISGDAQTSGSALHADVKITHGDDPTILWAAGFTRPANEIDALREQMTTKVADVVVCALGGRNPSIEELGVETLRLYMSACEQKHGDWNESAKLLQQVVARKPDFARGWAMLAAGTATAALQRPDEVESLHRQAEVYAQHALALDPRQGEAYYARAEAMPGLANWSRRMDVLAAGHAVDPTNAPTNVLTAWALAQVGRWREARVAAQQAFDFDPFSAGQASMLARLTGFGGDIEKANALLAIGRKRFPESISLKRVDLRLAVYLGAPQRARALLADPTLDMDSATTASWTLVLAARADPSEAVRDRAAQAVVASLGQKDGSVFSAVERLAFLHRIDQAYAVADKFKGDAATGSELLFTSVAAPLRADPRFMMLAARIGLARLWQQSDRWPDFCQDPALPYDCRAEATRALLQETPPPSKELAPATPP